MNKEKSVKLITDHPNFISALIYSTFQKNFLERSGLDSVIGVNSLTSPVIVNIMVEYVEYVLEHAEAIKNDFINLYCSDYFDDPQGYKIPYILSGLNNHDLDTLDELFSNSDRSNNYYTDFVKCWIYCSDLNARSVK